MDIDDKMTELNFTLPVYSGPLDALLDMVRKHKLNIYDIEINILLDQFLEYIDRMSDADMEVTSDFLEMAAKLILIKSAALLPKDEAEQIKKELEGALIELALCKIVASRLREHYLGDVIFTREPMPMDIDGVYRRRHQPEELLSAYITISERSRKKASYEHAPTAPVVEKSYTTVFTGVLRILKHLRRDGEAQLSELYKGQPRSFKVATFLAVLELSKNGRIFISEDGERIRLISPSERKPVSPEEKGINDFS